MGEKIVVGMSGGVDSSMSVLLLKKQGWEPVGVSLKLAHWESCSNRLNENICCTGKSLRIARDTCKKLGVPYHVYGASHEFREKVMGYFDSELKKARTPNPCIICNRQLKFAKLFEFAKKHNIKYVATGHYAKTQFDKKTGEFKLLKAKDTNKDQTYGLCFLPQRWLGRIIFPLADYTKNEVYTLAKAEGFEVFMKVRQSQDLCFVSGKALPEYIRANIGVKPGPVKDKNGKTVGGHEGLHFHTIGEKHGINGKRYYVSGFDVQSNVMLVTPDYSSISEKEILLQPFSFISRKIPKQKIRVEAKVRYRQELAEATLYPGKGSLRVVFDKPQEAVTPGQVCAFYKGQACLGGGIINLKAPREVQ